MGGLPIENLAHKGQLNVPPCFVAAKVDQHPQVGIELPPT